jgi:hypothetical protein
MLRVARLMVLLASLFGLAGVAIAVSAGLSASFDRAAVETLTAWHGSPFDTVMRLASELGGGIGLSFLTVVALGVLIAGGRLRAAVFVSVAFIATDLGAGVLKALVARPRPSQPRVRVSATTGGSGILWLVRRYGLGLALIASRRRVGATR